jgi:phosphate/sulfate permease
LHYWTQPKLFMLACEEMQCVVFTLFRYTSAEYILGELSALSGSALWKMIAIIAKKPVSATQSIVGASVGFSLVLKGFQSIKWTMIRDIGSCLMTVQSVSDKSVGGVVCLTCGIKIDTFCVA